MMLDEVHQDFKGFGTELDGLSSAGEDMQLSIEHTCTKGVDHHAPRGLLLCCLHISTPLWARPAVRHWCRRGRKVIGVPVHNGAIYQSPHMLCKKFARFLQAAFKTSSG